MFPYPMQMAFTLDILKDIQQPDIVSRFKRMQGYNVPSSQWDGMLLVYPQNNMHYQQVKDPREFTYQNIENSQNDQIIESGKGIDWDREFANCRSWLFQMDAMDFKKMFMNMD